MDDKKKETHNVDHFDYKNVDKILANLNPHSRMFNRRRSGLTARQQRQFAKATKRARFMALVPYVSR
ncbi:MAG: 30S ribosomal protein S18 [Candidatus Pacebacteria bacterium]|nr:30S ribosomal protein S18 [Candidatus Paceibacterota bacterium]